jgi:hypothetical protein
MQTESVFSFSFQLFSGCKVIFATEPICQAIVISACLKFIHDKACNLIRSSRSPDDLYQQLP